MILRVYAIFDGKAGGFLQPFFCVNRAVALRMFMSAVQEKGHDFHKWASDYILYEIAEWHQETGKFGTYDVPENLGSGAQYLMGEVS